MPRSLLAGSIAGMGPALTAEHLSRGLTTPDGAEKRPGLPVRTTISLGET